MAACVPLGRRRSGRHATVAGTFLLLLAGLATPSPALGATLLVTPATGAPGQVLTASGTGFPNVQPIFLRWDGAPLPECPPPGGCPVKADGTFAAPFAIPATASLGPHIVRACSGTVCNPFAEATVAVVPTPPTPTPAATPQPTIPPTPSPTRGPTPGPSATPGPTVAPGPTLTPGPTGPLIPVPSFPVAVPTPLPTPLPFVAITPAPEPPSNEAAPDTPFPNLIAAGIEVTQGIQNLANDMPLVAGRTTYARVYVDVQGAASWPNTWGALEARRGGQQIGWIWPDNGPIIARAGGGERTELDDSLYFRLPAEWLSGTVTLTTFVFSYTVATPETEEPNADDNVATETVTFRDGLPLTLHLAPLHLHRSFHPSDVERIYQFDPGGDYVAPGSTVGATNRILAGMYRYLPIAAAAVDALSTPVTPIGHESGHEWDLGGICRTSVIEWNADNHITLADWTVLMEEPDEIDPATAGSVTPDRAEVKVMDRTFTIDYFYPQEDGTGSLWGSSDGFGPKPPPGAPAYAHRCLILVPALHEPNETLALYRVFYDWAEEREFFAGMIDPTLRTAFSGGIASGGTGSLSMRMTDSFDDAWSWWHSGAETIGHEMAHKAGLGHVPCSDDDGDGVPDELDGGALDLTHPMTLTFPDCWLSEVDPDGYYGFDVYWASFGLPGPSVISNDPAAPAPHRAFPLLAYRFPGWPDPFHYCRMLAYYGVTCSATELDLPWNPENPTPDGSDPFAAFTPPPAEPLEPGGGVGMVAISQDEDGGVTVELLARSNQPTLDNLEAIGALETYVPPEGSEPLRIAVLGPDGGDVWSAALPPAWRPHEFHDGAATSVVLVPLAASATRVEIRGPDGSARATIDGRDGAPVPVRFATPAVPAPVEPDDEVLVAFELGDPGSPDRDRLSFTLLYAPDGRHWQVVGLGRTERQVRVRASDLPSGDAPAFRLVGFDGWSTGEATMAVPELAAPRNPPQVRILAAAPARYPMNALVRLEATAFDLEDRLLPGEAIYWSSSIDGELGPGSELATRDLSPGRHTITATAEDSDGLRGSATYVLEVDPAVVEARPSQALVDAIGATFQRLAAGLAPDDDSALPWAPVALGGALVLVVAGGAYALRRRRPAMGGAAPLVATAPPGGASVGSPRAAGANELSMDDTAGAEQDAGSGDVTMKGSKIKEN